MSKLKNEELHCELKNRVAEERKLTHQILQIIVEIDLRKLYLPMACSSLFDYLVRRSATLRPVPSGESMPRE
ncbi:MAG: hypothetical protein IPK04_12445 [Bdellovibrionales bacterium]|nr:hypothetical protein [Bdellovibrionales bacterium]